MSYRRGGPIRIYNKHAFAILHVHSRPAILCAFWLWGEFGKTRSATFHRAAHGFCGVGSVSTDNCTQLTGEKKLTIGDTCTQVQCRCINLYCSNFPLYSEGARAGAFFCTDTFLI
jgi:hypothetical protein